MEKAKLKQVLADHMKLVLPPRNEAKEYSDWVADLYEADAYYVSRAQSVLGRVPVDVDVATMTNLARTFKAHTDSGDFAPEETIASYRVFLQSLWRLIEAINSDPAMAG